MSFDDNDVDHRKRLITERQSQPVLDNLDKSTNKLFLTVFLITMNIPGILIGYSMGYSNQVTPCFNVKFNWTTAHD